MEKLNFDKESQKPNEMQRVAKALGMDFNKIEDIHLCIIIQDKIKKLISENKKLKFTNAILKKNTECKNDYLRVRSQRINELQYADEFNKHKDKVYNKFRNEIQEKDHTINCLKQELRYYEEKLKLAQVI